MCCKTFYDFFLCYLIVIISTIFQIKLPKLHRCYNFSSSFMKNLIKTNLLKYKLRRKKIRLFIIKVNVIFYCEISNKKNC